MKTPICFAAALSFASIVFAQEPPVVPSVSSKPDIVEIAAGADDFTTLVTAIKAAGLEETLKGKGPFTLFAPTNMAFAELPKGTLEDLLKPANKAKLAEILTYHVVPGKVMAADLTTSEVATLQGARAKFTVAAGKVTIDGANVTRADIVAGNGVVHVIDKVIMPAK